MADREAEEANLEYTPTWTVAVVCTVFVAISLLMERSIHRLGKWFQRHNQKPLNAALEKMKDELMLLGFISLLLTVFQRPVSKICIPASFTHHMLPCKLTIVDGASPVASEEDAHHRRLLQYHIRDNSHSSVRRILSGGGGSTHCQDKGKASFLPIESLHQLHIFIFVLAVVHVVISVLTMLLGSYKIHRWKVWEDEIKIEEEDPSKGGRYKDIMENPFFQKHTNRPWSEHTVLRWMVSFFRQFFKSVTKADYITLRFGFINTHLRMNKKFDFHKYMIRTLEDDFKRVVGISGYLWLYVVLFLLLNIHGWHTYFWVSFIPLLLLLLVGTKLQHVITDLAIQVQEKQSVDEGDCTVKPRDELFWLSRPRILLYLIHLILFQNAFEFAFFFWVLTNFGIDSCFMENVPFIVIRLFVGVVIQILCSYSTLPLYALVTQMGSNFKKAIFEERVATALEGWHLAAKKRKRNNNPVAKLKRGDVEAQVSADQNICPTDLPNFEITRRPSALADIKFLQKA